MTNPPMDNSDAHPTVVTVYDIEGGADVQVVEALTFYGDCVTSARACAEEWLHSQGYIPINLSGGAWEQQGIGSMQATMEAVP